MTVTSKSIYVRWREPLIPNGIITEYRVQVYDNITRKEVNTTLVSGYYLSSSITSDMTHTLSDMLMLLTLTPRYAIRVT